MRLSVKIAVYMLGVIAFAVLLLTYLTNAKFRSLQEEVERSRFLALALDVKGTAERGLALGLGLEEMHNLGAILARLDRDHPEILSLRILDDQGGELHAAGPALEPAATLAGLHHLRVPGTAGGEAGLRDVSGDSAFGLMVPLLNAFGQATGVLVLHYDRGSAAAAARAVTLEQLRVAALALLVGGLGALLTAALYLRGVTRGFARMTRWAEEETPAAVAEGGEDDLERRFLAVRHRADEVEAMVVRAENSLRRG